MSGTENPYDSELDVTALSPELRVELDRRLDDLEASPNKLLTWEQVLEEMRGKL